MPDGLPAQAPGARLFAYPQVALGPKSQGQSELLLEFVEWAREINAAMAAQRALLAALIATHKQPAELLAHFQQGMDMVADAVPPDQVADYRREMQLLQGLLLNAVNGGPGA
ncbi:MAG: hypothetical protein Q8S02_18285 [Hydrogenophaga sp.]|nr:hypothetical protein [Hydrogenophaga sp.]